MFVGMLVWGAVSDALGRRTALLGSMIVIVACGTASALAPSFRALLALRVLLGMGVSGEGAIAFF